MKLRLSCVFAAVWMATFAVEASQSRPVFTGTWTLAAEENASAVERALGLQFRVTQEADRVVLELPQTEFVRLADGSTKVGDAGLGLPTAYLMDGVERTTRPMSGIVTVKGRTVAPFFVGGRYRVSWSNNNLVLATTEIIPMTSFNNGAFAKVEFTERASTTTFSMQGNGTLLVERSTPEPTRQFRNTYARK